MSPVLSVKSVTSILIRSGKISFKVLVISIGSQPCDSVWASLKYNTPIIMQMMEREAEAQRPVIHRLRVRALRGKSVSFTAANKCMFL